MKALFVHDHFFFLAEDGFVYSKGGLPAAIWSRYTEHFSSLTVIGRKSPKILTVEQTKHFVKSSADNVSFELFDNISGVATRILNMRLARARMSRLVNEHDVVIARLASELGLLAIREVRRQKKPWAVELVGCPWDVMLQHGSIAGKIYAPFLAYRVRSVVSKASHVLYVTEEFLQSRYPATSAKLTVACSNVELPSVSESVIEKRLASIENLSSRKKFVFGLIGSLDSHLKGIDVAIRALSLSRVALGPFEFRVLGGGDPAPWIKVAREAGISEFVKFDGLCSGRDGVNQWLDKIDIYLQPSFSEGLPRALIEAMSRGCPALASRVGGIPELLRDKFLIDAGDTCSLSSKIVSFSENNSLLKEVSKANFLKAKQYSSDRLNRQRQEFWCAFANSSV